ncbi:MAG: BrnT family toxin [Planctomycetes bacterium]|nr:BrnT family toxin [Planctomycetota bacterium]
MRIVRFEWDEANQEHVACHGVHSSEAEEVLRRGPYLRRGRQERYLAYGSTAHGRPLLVVFVAKGQGCVRVVTARDMTRREREAYRRRKR